MKFHVSEVLTVGTDCLVAFRGVGAVYDVLNHMTGESLFTHVLPRAWRACQPVVLRLYPWMAGLDCDGITPETYRQWVADVVRTHMGAETDDQGPMLDVPTLEPGAWARRDPMAEAVELFGRDRIASVVVR